MNAHCKSSAPKTIMFPEQMGQGLEGRRMTEERLGSSLVFLVGAPRSGTTYLQKLLAGLEGIETAQESYVFEYISPMVKLWNMHVSGIEANARGGEGLPCYLDEEEFVAAVRQLFWELLGTTLKGIPKGHLFIEKTPMHALHIDVIDYLLPRARFIHLIRDPRDVVASMLAAARSWGRYWAPTEAGDAARVWRRHVNSARTLGRRLGSDRYTELRYEDLVANPERELLHLGEFLAARWSIDELSATIERNRFGNSPRDAGTPIPRRGLTAKRSGSVVNEPAGFSRKGQPGSWRTDLTFLEKVKVWRWTRRIRSELGYSG